MPELVENVIDPQISRYLVSHQDLEELLNAEFPNQGIKVEVLLESIQTAPKNGTLTLSPAPKRSILLSGTKAIHSGRYIHPPRTWWHVLLISQR